MNDVLASIDAELTRCICGQPIPEDWVSLDYCSPKCQYEAMAARAGIEPEDDWDEDDELVLMNGREINEAVREQLELTLPTATVALGPPLSAAPTLGELNRSVTVRMTVNIRPFVEACRSVAVPMRNGARTADTWAEAWERASEAAASPGEYAALARRLYDLGANLPQQDEPQPTPEEFRARALEHVRNRNTGPQRPDNRRWRNT